MPGNCRYRNPLALWRGYFYIERIKGMGVVRVAIGFITAASIRTCIGFQNRRNAVTGSPFPGENAAVDRVRGEPQLSKLDTLTELMPFPFREDFLLALVNFQSAGISYF